MKDFFNAISSHKGTSELLSVFVISNDFLGEYALIEGGNIVLASNESPNWLAAAQQAQANLSNYATIDNTKFFIEKLSSVPHLVLFGAGHVSLAIVKIAKILNFHITVVDERPMFTATARAAGADEIITDSFESAFKKLPNYDNCYYVVVTRGHSYDKECLVEILKNRQYNYVGLMSSKPRLALVKRDLRDMGISTQTIDSLHSPIGLNIGAKTPEEIAVSVMAEIVQSKNSRALGFGYPEEFLNELSKYDNLNAALCTIINRKGSAPREVTAKMVVLDNGVSLNTIGGGCVEAEIRNIALDVINDNNATIAQSNMTIAQAEDEGMVCGGIVDVLIQPIV